MNTDLIGYYHERAAEYEKIYAKPERKHDLQEAAQILQRIFQGKAVFEIACGTGYWTERLAKTATSIVATDINASVLEIAKSKVYTPATVTFEQADFFKLPIPAQPYKNLFGGFIWSHIPIQEIDAFLETVCRQIEPRGSIAFMDNNYVEGSNLPITHRDELGNTYQTRQLENGNTYEVLKNFPDKAFITSRLQERTTDIKVIWLRYYWIAVCKNK